jgi:hypothetical protein
MQREIEVPFSKRKPRATLRSVSRLRVSVLTLQLALSACPPPQLSGFQLPKVSLHPFSSSVR